MKKVFLFLVLFLIPCSVLGMSIEENYFKDGLSKPEDVYITSEVYIGDNMNLWLMHSESISKIIKDYNEIGHQEFEKKYDLNLLDFYVQIDWKIDDGEYHYNNDWDNRDYKSIEDIYYMIYSPEQLLDLDDNSIIKKICFGESGYIEEENDAGFLKDILIDKYMSDDTYYGYDFENHTLSFKVRYGIEYKTNQMEEINHVYSKWTDEIKFGKDSNQKELYEVISIDAPILSEISYIRENLWKVYFNIPNSVYDAIRYYSIEKNIDLPISVLLESKINDDIWKEQITFDASSLYNGYKFLEMNATSDDNVYLRAKFIIDNEKLENSGWSNIISNEKKEKVIEQNDDTANITTININDNQSTCLFNNDLCCTKYYNISLCIWIIIGAVILLILLIMMKNKKTKE